MDYKTYLEKKAALEGGFGRVIVTHNGRTATDVEGLDFIARAEGLDIEVEEAKAKEAAEKAVEDAKRAAKEQEAKEAEERKRAADEAKKAEAARKEQEAAAKKAAEEAKAKEAAEKTKG